MPFLFTMPGLAAVIVTRGKLKEIVADALRLTSQLQTIEVHLRNLREAGLIAKAQRGRGAATMGPDDAANLLLAIAGSSLVKDSVAAAEGFSALALDPLSVTVQGLAEMGERRGVLPLTDLHGITSSARCSAP